MRLNRRQKALPDEFPSAFCMMPAVGLIGKCQGAIRPIPANKFHLILDDVLVLDAVFWHRLISFPLAIFCNQSIHIN
jgi:hypothetical protein